MITGSIVALITPFDEDGNVSYDRLAGLVEWHISEKTDGILVLGTTAETPTLTDEEEERIVRKVIEKAGSRVPVIAGSGSNNTQMCIEKSLKYQNMGADALLVITPYYNKTFQAFHCGGRCCRYTGVYLQCAGTNQYVGPLRYHEKTQQA